MKNWRSFAAPLGILLVLAGAAFFILNRQPLLSKQIVGEFVKEFGSPQVELRLTVPFVRNSERMFYLHAAVDFDGDGSIGGPRGSGSVLDEWVVQNIAVYPSHIEPYRYSASLPSMVEDLTGKSGVIVLTTGPIEPHEWGAYLPKTRDRAEFIITGMSLDEAHVGGSH
jgi:hypothetical protein